MGCGFMPAAERVATPEGKPEESSCLLFCFFVPTNLTLTRCSPYLNRTLG